MPKSMKGWWKKWFYLRNDTDVPFLVFTGNCPIPQSTWVYGAMMKDLDKMQPLCKVIQ
jgi:hypothetical protein